MKCSICEIDYEEKYFLLKNVACYKCVYHKKIEEINSKKKLEKIEKKCRVCKTPLPKNKWVYCCFECARIGKKKYQETFWQKTLKNPIPNNFNFLYGKGYILKKIHKETDMCLTSK
jgi:hypothetical protein